MILTRRYLLAEVECKDILYCLKILNKEVEINARKYPELHVLLTVVLEILETRALRLGEP